MHDDQTFRTTAAVAAIASLPVAAGNVLTMLWAVGFNLDALADPLVLLRAGAAGAALWRWSMLLDLLGYYLMIIPLILSLRTRFRRASPAWMDLAALSLLLYCVVGAMGASVMTSATPRLIRSFAEANANQRVILGEAALAYADSIYRGLWNLLEELLGGIGWIAMGAVMRTGRRGLGRLSLALGIACLIDSLGTMIDFDPIAMAGLVVYLVLAPVWAVSAGILLLGEPAMPAARVAEPRA